jgi:hypothetical protein
MSRKFHLDGVLMNLETGRRDTLVFESLKVAKEAGKAQSSQAKITDLEDVLS